MTPVKQLIEPGHPGKVRRVLLLLSERSRVANGRSVNGNVSTLVIASIVVLQQHFL